MSNITTELQRQEIEMVKKINDLDLDSIEDERQKRKTVHDITLQETLSVNSSINFGSDGTQWSNNSVGSIGSIQSTITNKESSMNSMTEAAIGNLIEPGMSEGQIRTRTEEWLKHQQKKNQQKTQAELEKILQKRREKYMRKEEKAEIKIMIEGRTKEKKS